MSKIVHTTLEKICLEEKGSIISGPFGSNISKKFFVNSGIPVIRGNNLKLSFNKFYDDGFVFVTKEKAKELNCYAIRSDLIFTAAGTIGQVGIIPNDSDYEIYVISNKQIRARIDTKKVDILYAYYWFSSPWIRKTLISNNKGSTVPLLTLSEIKDLPISYPENIASQHNIAQIIETISQKIQLNDKMNAELKAMAKTIYDYWFTQFDFPDENGKPYLSSGGKMVWNNIIKREIPVGWETKEIKSIEQNIVTGKTPLTQNREYYNGDIPFITIGDIRGNMFVITTEITLTKAGADSQPTKYIPENAICVTCIASPGLVGFATKSSQTNQQINVVVCEDPINRLFLYFAIKDHFKFSSGAKTGNTFANMNKDDFETILLVYPVKTILEKFHDKTIALAKQIKLLSQENQELTTLRDWLLPMLMNGQATVE